MVPKYLGYAMKLMHILFHLHDFTAAFDLHSFSFELLSAWKSSSCFSSFVKYNLLESISVH